MGTAGRRTGADRNHASGSGRWARRLLLDAVIAIGRSRCLSKVRGYRAGGNFGAIRTFAEYGTADQKTRYLPGLLAGEDVIAVAMTEPDAGSALTELSTSARRDGDGYRLNGSQIFTTNIRHASLFLAYVRFGPGVAGIGSILVERDTPGLEFGKPSRFMNGEEWQQLHFDNCHVPEANVLLPAGGFKRQIKGFNVERIGNSARSLALGGWPSTSRGSTPKHVANSDARYAISRAFNGNSPKWR